MIKITFFNPEYIFHFNIISIISAVIIIALLINIIALLINNY